MWGGLRVTSFFMGESMFPKYLYGDKPSDRAAKTDKGYRVRCRDEKEYQKALSDGYAELRVAPKVSKKKTKKVK